MKFLKNYSLKAYNTFGIEVDAQYFVQVASALELIEAYAFAKEKSLDIFVLGGGSNVLFTSNFSGLIIHVNIKGIETIEESAEHVLLKVGAGEDWDDWVAWTVEHKYGGLENLSLIPGSVGASPVQNIGAYGIEIKDHFHSLKFLHFASSEVQVFNKQQCEFGYRNSIFKNALKGKGAVLSVCFKLDKNPGLNTSYGSIQDELTALGIVEPEITHVRQAVISIRESKLPDPANIGNAGSFFKNPVITQLKFDEIFRSYPNVVAFPQKDGQVKLAAGWLIDQSGWKGFRENNSGVHDKQALVLVNHGGASGSEIVQLAEKIQASIFDQFGVTLEREVNIL